MMTKNIRNRDVITLSKANGLWAGLEAVQKRLDWLNDKKYSMMQVMNGMPSAHNKKGLDDLMADIDEVQREMEEERQEFFRAIAAAQKILKNIGNLNMRTFVRMKYYNCEPDSMIQKQMGMSRKQFESACENIENAPCMGKVRWEEKYRLVENPNFGAREIGEGSGNENGIIFSGAEEKAGKAENKGFVADEHKG